MTFKHPLLTALVLAAAGQMFCWSLPAHAAGKLCQVSLTGDDMIMYNKKVLKVAADCTQVKLTLTHVGKLPKTVMGHDWVLTTPEDAAAVATDGIAAGLANDYVKPGDKRVIAHTKVIGGGQSTSVTFSTAGLKKGSPYTYECTFPGHHALMHGTFTIG